MLIGQPNAEQLAEEIVARGLNVRQVEAMAREAGQKHGKGGKGRGAQREAEKNADLVALEKRVSDALGLVVSIDDSARGGTLTDPLSQSRSARRSTAPAGEKALSVDLI